jgi:hypothetical protein
MSAERGGRNAACKPRCGTVGMSGCEPQCEVQCELQNEVQCEVPKAAL